VEFPAPRFGLCRGGEASFAANYHSQEPGHFAWGAVDLVLLVQLRPQQVLMTTGSQLMFYICPSGLASIRPLRPRRHSTGHVSVVVPPNLQLTAIRPATKDERYPSSPLFPTAP
jgi:hypothetical protein